MVPKPSDRFKDNLMSFVEFCKDLVSKIIEKKYTNIDPQLVSIAGNFLEVIDNTSLIEGFIKKSNKHWQKVKVRDEDFFIKHSNEIFAGLPETVVSNISKIFSLKDASGEHLIEKPDRENIWKFFESFVKISIKYIHEKRKPYAVSEIDAKGEPCVVDRYGEHFMTSEIKLKHIAEIWGVKLVFPLK